MYATLRYSNLTRLPESFLGTYGSTIGNLNIYVSKKDAKHDQFVDLLTLLRARASRIEDYCTLTVHKRGYLNAYSFKTFHILHKIMW